MNNRIVKVTIRPQRVTPVEAEVLVVVETEALTPGTELRGRLVGPHCPGVETIEVAYPLRGMAAGSGAATELTGRVVVPEPNLWTAETPFRYEGTVELWQDGRRCDSRPLAVEFRAR